MRTQFTFYESFYKALSCIKDTDARCAAYDVICSYALTGEIPDFDELPDAVALAFEMARPVLDSAAKKAKNGRSGGSKSKAKESKPKANRSKAKANASKPEANASEKEGEKEKEKENEIEIEDECYISPLSPLDENFGEAGPALSEWLRYKAERGEPYKPQGLTAFLDTVRRNIKAHGADAVAAVIRDSMASGYHGVTWDRVRGMPQNAESRQHAFDEMVAEFMAEGDAS